MKNVQGICAPSGRGSLPLKFFEKNRKLVFAYFFELDHMELKYDKMWKIPGPFVPQVVRAVYL